MVIVDKTLEERQKTHGSWLEGSEVSQQLKKVMSKNVKLRPAFVNEALDRICMKLSRIATGDPMVLDHWHDIQGYSLLVEKELTKYDDKNV